MLNVCTFVCPVKSSTKVLREPKPVKVNDVNTGSGYEHSHSKKQHKNIMFFIKPYDEQIKNVPGVEWKKKYEK